MRRQTLDSLGRGILKQLLLKLALIWLKLIVTKHQDSQHQRNYRIIPLAPENKEITGNVFHFNHNVKVAWDQHYFFVADFLLSPEISLLVLKNS